MPPRTNAAFMRPLQPDVKLAAIVGGDPLPRTAIVKKLWDHIKAHDLQNAENRRVINCDNALKALFDGAAQISMFDLGKAINRHTQPAPAAVTVEG